MASENQTGVTNALRVYLFLFLLLLFAFTYIHQKRFDAPTPVSRLNLMHALMHGTFRIDAYHRNTPDKAVLDGHYYSDKAPGTVALAFPAFAAAAVLLELGGVPLDSELGWLATSWVASAASNGLPAALGGLALFAWLSRRVEPRWAFVTTLAIFLGAAPLPYATMMFSHALVVGLLAVAIWAIEKQAASSPRPSPPPDGGEGDETPVRPGPYNSGQAGQGLSSGRAGAGSGDFRFQLSNCRFRYDALAGFACGLALASEYTAGIIVVALFLWLISHGWRRGIPFCVAAVPPLLLIPAYSYACFGNPFILPYSLQASFPAMQEGLYAIKWPDAQTAANLLFHPAKGLFFWTPFLVMAGFGYYKLFEHSPRLFWLTYAIPLLQIVVISGRVWDWEAGPTLGPRYLAPILPLLTLPCAYGVQNFPKPAMALAGYSILITTLATLTDACPMIGAHSNPLLDLHIPLFREGEFSPNLGMALGLPPHASIALYYGVLAGGAAWLWRRMAGMNVGATANRHEQTQMNATVS